jgi:hypothetical protein
MKHRVYGADAAGAANSALPPLGNLGGRLAEANRWGLCDKWTAGLVWRLPRAPHIDVGIKFSTFPRLSDLRDIEAHLCTYGTGHSARDVSKVELAARFATRPHALALILRGWLFPLERAGRTAPADVDTGLEFCLDNPGLVGKLMLADAAPAPTPFRLTYRAGPQNRPLQEDDLARFLDSFPEDRGRIIGGARGEFGPFLNRADPRAVGRYVSAKLGVEVDPRLGELVSSADLNYAAQLAGVDPAVCAHLPSVNRFTREGLSRSIHAAAYSQDVNRALSSILRGRSTYEPAALKPIERRLVYA